MVHIYKVWRIYLALLLGTGLASVAPVNAQTTGGQVVGTVLDESGGALPGVTVTVRNVQTGLTRTVVSEANGSYRVVALPPGEYQVRAELEGFAPAEATNLVLTIGLELRRDLALKIGSLEESVTVSAAAPVVDTSRSEVGGVVTQQQIDTLPVASRQPVALALLMPGTSTDATRPRKFNATIGAGATFFSSNFLADGVWNQEAAAGEPRQDFPQAAIREFKVSVSQASAEYGATTGGVVTIVTKGGTNRWSGEVFEYFRDKRLNTMNRFEEQLNREQGEPKPEFRRYQFGGAFGGPVIRDRIHFFVAAERTDQKQFITVNTGRPEFYSALEGSFESPYWSNNVFVRGDAQITPQQSLFVRYGWQEDDIHCETCGGSQAAFSGSGVFQPRDSLVAGHTWVFGSQAVNEFRFQRAYYGFFTHAPGVPAWTTDNFPPARFAPLTPTYNFPSLTWGSAANTGVQETITEFRNDLSFGWGFNQTWKLGFAYMDFPMWDHVPGNALGSWTFATDQRFDPTDASSFANLTNPIQFTTSLPPFLRRLENRFYQAYVQNEWRPRSNLTVNAGLRYDLQDKAFNQDLPQSQIDRLPYVDPSSRGDTNNIAPRLGLTWDLLGDSTNVLRAGYGVYYQPLYISLARGEHTAFRQSNVTVRNPSYPDPYGGRDPLSFASTAPQNISTLANDIENAKAHAANAGFSRGLTATLGIHVDGVYTRTRGIPIAFDRNMPDPVTGQRPLPAFRRIDEARSLGGLNYRALMVRFDKRFERGYQYLISYTLAKTDSNLAFSGTAASTRVTDPFNPDLDWGPGNTDRRHSLVASGAVLLPFDVTLGVVWSIRSTMPFTALAGRDLNGDGVVNDYVPGTSRNQGNRNLNVAAVNEWRADNGLGPVSADQFDSNRFNAVDLRANKTFRLPGRMRLEVIGQVFNLLGSDNLLASGGSGWVTNSLSNSFGRVLQAQNRQQGELAVRLAW